MDMPMSKPLDWVRIGIAIVGGDKREAEIARLAALAGVKVKVHGFPVPPAAIAGVEATERPDQAMAGVRFALFPMAGMKDGLLYAPHAAKPIRPDAQMLSGMAPKAHIILGHADAELKSAAAQRGIVLHEREHDRELRLSRAPSVVEGALSVIIQNTEISIHRAQVLVFGYGPIGALLGRALDGLGARVTIAARNPQQRAAAIAYGLEAVPLDGADAIAPDLDMVVNTVPHRIVERGFLAKLRAGSLVLDLASPPGGIDLDAAKSLGHRALWARGLGSRAPLTVGRCQWEGARGLIERICLDASAAS